MVTVLKSDIGIDIDGMMYVLFHTDTVLPIKEQFIIELKAFGPTIRFYQGQSVFVENNKNIGQLELLNNKMGMFEMDCEIVRNDTNTHLNIIINENIETFSFINEVFGTTNEEEELIRKLETCKYNYINYINQTINTLEQIKDKINIKILNKVKRALQIIYIDDITIQEYELAQQEIEELVNPIINNLASASSS
jgi:hypothetical protein